jgi:hypothetical protein
MPGDPRLWNPKRWEEHIQLLLKRRYSPGHYQHVPDTVGGDLGVEGFATDGSAYQCYAAQECVTAAELLHKQKNKITADIGKFKNNEAKLVALFGTLRISIWNLVVPYWNDKELIQHATKKALEVRELNLMHVADAFRISILTQDDFAVEAQLLAHLNLLRFDVAAPPVAPRKLAEWMDRRANLELVSNLRHKAELLAQGRSQDQREVLQARIVANYIGGNLVLGRLERDLPETYAKIADCKAGKEANLEAESIITNKVPAEFFESTLQRYREEVAAVPGIGPNAANTLAWEAVSDWVLRCPMRFD